MYRSTSTSTPSRPKHAPTHSVKDAPMGTGIPQSSSLPVLPTITSPTRPSLPSTPSTKHLQSPQTPASSSKNKNFHPYLIQTTSSSLLSRTNSSPAQPLYEGGTRHRVSRSMSALNKPEGVVLERTESGTGTGSEAGSEDGTPGRGSPSTSTSTSTKPMRVGMKRSGTLPSFPSTESLREKARPKEVELPNDPKTWTASELALYLSKTLRKGTTTDQTEQTLPGPLVDDIKSWILRHQVTGRAFLKGPETWTTSSRPPPFLPLLTSISRRLRRSSMQSRISGSNGHSGSIAEDAEDVYGTSSVLVEESEDDIHDAVPRGVKGMAQAYDAIHSSASEASGDEGLDHLRQTHTGDQQQQHRREVWKRWEAEMRPVRLSRQDTGSSMGSVDEVMLAAARGPISMAVAEAETSETDEDEEGLKGGTIKPSMGRTTIVPVELTSSASSSGSGTSPAPAYLSSSPEKPDQNDNSNSSIQLITPVKQGQGLGQGGRSASHSVTPTPDPQRAIHLSEAGSPAPEGPAVGSISSTTTNTNTNTNARQSLGRSTSRRIPIPISDQDRGEETDDENDQSTRQGQRHYSSARRVTIRPAPRVSSRAIFTPAPQKSEREQELETQLEEMKIRLEELEGRLNTVAAGITSNQVIGNGNDAGIASFIFGKLGLRTRQGEDGDGLPNTVKELPVYLFLVGFGVGAVVVRVLFSRR